MEEWGWGLKGPETTWELWAVRSNLKMPQQLKTDEKVGKIYKNERWQPR